MRTHTRTRVHTHTHTHTHIHTHAVWAVLQCSIRLSTALILISRKGKSTRQCELEARAAFLCYTLWHKKTAHYCWCTVCERLNSAELRCYSYVMFDIIHSFVLLVSLWIQGENKLYMSQSWDKHLVSCTSLLFSSCLLLTEVCNAVKCHQVSGLYHVTQWSEAMWHSQNIKSCFLFPILMADGTFLYTIFFLFSVFARVKLLLMQCYHNIFIITSMMIITEYIRCRFSS